MILGSHNTMTYLPIKQWYFKPLFWMARCQSKSLREQFESYGVRMFDIRIRFDGYTPIFAHGFMEYKGDVYDYLDYLDEVSQHDIYIRIFLESNTEMKDQSFQEERFKVFCKEIQERYEYLTFFGGVRKYDGKTIYNFNTTPLSLDGKYSSDDDTILNDLWPWIYAKRHNKASKCAGTTKDVLFLDFVNI